MPRKSKYKYQQKKRRHPRDPVHGFRPLFNPDHALWDRLLSRLGTGVYEYSQLSVWAESEGSHLNARQIQRGINRYAPASLPMRVFPWLAELVQHVLDNFVNWDAQLDAAITQQVQLVGMLIKQMRNLRERPEIVSGPDGNPLTVLGADGVTPHYVVLPAATLDGKINLLNAVQAAVGRLFRMICDRTRLHAEMQAQVPRKEGENLPLIGVSTLYTANINLVRQEMEEVEREMRDVYNLLIKEAAEVGATLPEPKPLDPRHDEEID